MNPCALAETPGYRIEQKYFISASEAAALRARLDPILGRDPHSDERRHYSIASLYLDDREDHALIGSLLGVNARKKYRIRAYNGSDDFISVECKQKEGRISRKTSFAITRADYDRLIAGDPSPLLTYPRDLAKQLYCDIRTAGYRPRSLVVYERETFVHPIERVRITLDTNLRGSDTVRDLFATAPLRSLLPRDAVLLEVKYDRFLPAFIADLLPRDCMPATANCKYVRSRTL